MILKKIITGPYNFSSPIADFLLDLRSLSSRETEKADG
jgi:hypothetical protein